MNKTQKKQVKKYISWGCILLLVIVLAVMPLLASTEEDSDGPVASILSAEAERRDIATQIIGGGMLVSETAVEITIPESVKLTQYLVNNGDLVSEGDAVAKVDRVSVMTAITEIQETLDTLAEEIEDESGEEAPDEVIAQTGGTVKMVYAQAGEKVQDVMLEHGALAVLSLDGLMAVQIERNTNLTAGDSVCVTLSDGSEVDGHVESNLEGILTVTVEDDDYAVGESVKVTSEDGTRIGTGKLYIHSQWNAMAYSGTVKSVKISEGKTVSAGSTLMTLTDTGATAQYQQLIIQRQEYEKRMLELFRMYQSQTLTAPCDGVISGVDESGAYMLSAEGGWTLSLLANAPNGDDETSYTNLVGQITAVALDGWIVMVNLTSWEIEDYSDLSGVSMDTAAMTQSITYSGTAPVYQMVDGEWQQINSVSEGDILLFAGSENGIVWIVKVGHEDIGTDAPTGPEEEETPVNPSDPADPDNEETKGDDMPSAPEESDDEETKSNDMPSGTSQPSGGTGSGYSGGTVQEESSLYSLGTVTVASVTPQKEMTLEITIDELDISRIYLGQEAEVLVNALNGESFAAVVTQIGNSGTSDGGNSKFAVELTLERSGDMLGGMNATAVITLDTAENVLTLPVAALNDEKTETIVYTSYDEEKGVLSAPVCVSVGVSDGEYAQILSGIDEGTTCYYAYYDTLEISNVPEAAGFSFWR